MVRKSLAGMLLLLLVPALAWGVEVYNKGDVSLDIGYWAQAWYQYVEADGPVDGKTHDFMIRRTYLSIGGTVTPELSFFAHYAGDRIGQDGLDDPSNGLGSGLALRDAWVTYKLLGNDLMVQVGRMYVPFTRNYGTTSTKALLTTELDWGQGGIRSGIFYPSKVGRDDGVTVWGNVLEDKLQYRLMVGEGAEGNYLRIPNDPTTSTPRNPDDELRVAGRLSFNLFDPETGWFNRGTYLGDKRILAIGAGFDYQDNLDFGGREKDYRGYTLDIEADLPMAGGALTAGAAYIRVDNVVNGIISTDIAAGDDADILSAHLGYLIGSRFQPFAHVERFMPDESGDDDSTVYGFGCNYYVKGQANKLTAEWTRVDTDDSYNIVTLQAAFGF